MSDEKIQSLISTVLEKLENNTEMIEILDISEKEFDELIKKVLADKNIRRYARINPLMYEINNSLVYWDIRKSLW
ncbi:hypothetical protein ACKUB1_12150 [Methanospirillum stamsii]|uniref:Uncharacterized protein n=1 Tax=Methanospirillum stamsii TaxID=1277351 RepID=A0A2V2N1R2_9EURY|nr:hypothetical protein [Methanospirillum stamsii]PWR70468.1 hypothetical protein DLD82_15455 [Methanospirillum stamsii]